MFCLDLCIFQCIFFILLSVMMMASAQWTWVLASSRSYWGTGNRMLLHPGSQIFRHSLETELQFSCSVVSYSLWPHGLQHTRLPCPSPSPGTCWNTSPSSQWWHPTISSSVIAFSSCPQPFPASESFPMRWLFMSGGQSTGVSDPHPLKHSYRDKSSSIYVDWATEMPIKYKTVCDLLHI